MLAAQLPICQQLGLVEFGPIQHKFLRTPGEESGEHVHLADSDRRFEFTILCVEMRRSMLVKKHTDDDAVENTDGRA